MPTRETFYVVLNRDGKPMRLFRYSDDDTPGGVLVTGDEGHLFRHRYTAKRAIERTRRYAEANDLPWDLDHRIERLVVYAAGGAAR